MYASIGIEKIILYSLFLASVILVPNSIDPITVPRLVVIAIFGFISLFILINNLDKKIIRKRKMVIFAGLIFIIWSIFAWLFSGINLLEGFYGVNGRHTGLLAYISIVSIFLLTTIVSAELFIIRIIKTLLICGLLASAYGSIQYLNLDPIDWDNGPYNRIIGFLGNPNFQSAFLGLTAIASFAMLFYKGSQYRLVKFISILYFFLTCFLIIKTQSEQGIFITLLGVFVVLYLWLRVHPVFSNLKLLLKLFFVLLAFLAWADIFQKGFWNSYFYTNSISYRGDFWRAGLLMIRDNPVFGVGLDGYRDHYRSSRDIIAGNRDIAKDMVDSAHNVFIDIASGGGLVLFLAYSVIVYLTLNASFKLIKRSVSFNPFQASLIGCWLAYTLQSIISINHLTLALWGWVLSGSIIGLEINSRGPETKGEIALKVGPLEVISIFIGSVIGIGVSVPQLTKDINFRLAIESGRIVEINKVVESWPRDVNDFRFTSLLYRQGGFNKEALIIAQKGAAFHTSNFEILREVYLNPSLSNEDKLVVYKKLLHLDPYRSALE